MGKKRSAGMAAFEHQPSVDDLEDALQQQGSVDDVDDMDDVLNGDDLNGGNDVINASHDDARARIIADDCQHVVASVSAVKACLFALSSHMFGPEIHTRMDRVWDEILCSDEITSLNYKEVAQRCLTNTGYARRPKQLPRSKPPRLNADGKPKKNRPMGVRNMFNIFVAQVNAKLKQQNLERDAAGALMYVASGPWKALNGDDKERFHRRYKPLLDDVNRRQKMGEAIDLNVEVQRFDELFHFVPGELVPDLRPFVDEARHAKHGGKMSKSDFADLNSAMMAAAQQHAQHAQLASPSQHLEASPYSQSPNRSSHAVPHSATAHSAAAAAQLYQNYMLQQNPSTSAAANQYGQSADQYGQNPDQYGQQQRLGFQHSQQQQQQQQMYGLPHLPPNPHMQMQLQGDGMDPQQAQSMQHMHLEHSGAPSLHIIMTGNGDSSAQQQHTGFTAPISMHELVSQQNNANHLPSSNGVSSVHLDHNLLASFDSADLGQNGGSDVANNGGTGYANNGGSGMVQGGAAASMYMQHGTGIGNSLHALLDGALSGSSEFAMLQGLNSASTSAAMNGSQRCDT